MIKYRMKFTLITFIYIYVYIYIYFYFFQSIQTVDELYKTVDVLRNLAENLET